MTFRLLVVENDSFDDPRRLGDWLTDAGLELDMCRPYAGDPLPTSLADHDGMLVMGGRQDAYAAPVEGTETAWFGALGALLRRAREERKPVLGVCLGGQQLAHAFGGRVAKDGDGYDIGPRLIGKRDAAGQDVLFSDLPLLPDVLEFHQDQVTVLPSDAVVLAASPRCPYEAFRIGETAWGVQFHIECDLDQFRYWLSENLDALDGADPDDMLARVEATLPDIEETWRPIAQRFAGIVKGEVPAVRRSLPVLGSDSQSGHASVEPSHRLAALPDDPHTTTGMRDAGPHHQPAAGSRLTRTPTANQTPEG